MCLDEDYVRLDIDWAPVVYDYKTRQTEVNACRQCCLFAIELVDSVGSLQQNREIEKAGNNSRKGVYKLIFMRTTGC